MNEAYHSRYDRPEMTPHTAGADDPNLSLDAAAEMVDAILNIGYVRHKQLEDYAAASQSLEVYRDGTFHIKHAHVGQYADFVDRSNHSYLKETYPWLTDVGDGLGFDVDTWPEEFDSFEAYLASITEDSWTAFFEELENLENYPVLDEQGMSDLEMKETDRWITEDGTPDMIKELMSYIDDAYEVFLVSKITPDLMYEWCRETGHYPESQGEGAVWLDVKSYAQQEETQNWFVEHIDDDHAGWEAVRTTFFESQGNKFDALLKKLAIEDEVIATVYNKLDADSFRRLWDLAHPDHWAGGDEPYWYFWKPYNATEIVWAYGWEPEGWGNNDWIGQYQLALEEMYDSDKFRKLVATFFERPPKDHPELKFESIDPDDPSIFMDYGGGLNQTTLYADDRIVLIEPKDTAAINHYLETGGYQPINGQDYERYFRWPDKIVILDKVGESDEQGSQSVKPLGILLLEDGNMRSWPPPTYGGKGIDVLLENVAVRKALLQYFRRLIEEDSESYALGNYLLKLGGPAELRRQDRKGNLRLDDYSLPLALYYVNRKQYKKIPALYGKPVEAAEPRGIWLSYTGFDDLAPVFENEKAAEEVFSQENYHWFDYTDEPEAKDVIPYLTGKAMKSIREALLNRRVWMPDAGENQRGDYVVLTKAVLDQYDDQTLKDWLSDPSDEDTEDGVFDDIIDAIKSDGRRAIESLSQDNVYTAYTDKAIEQIGGIEYKWGTSGVDKSGRPKEALLVLVRWNDIAEAATTYYSNENENFSGALEDLMVQANKKSASVDDSQYHASTYDFAKCQHLDGLFYEIYELEAPKPYVDPNQTQLALESQVDLDSPDEMPAMWSGIPVTLEKRVNAAIKDAANAEGAVLSPAHFKLIPIEQYSEEELDSSDGRLTQPDAGRKLALWFEYDENFKWRSMQRLFDAVTDIVVNEFPEYTSVRYSASMLDADVLGLEDIEHPESTLVFLYALHDAARKQSDQEVLDQLGAGEEIPF
jgi:hypothetical protein